MRHAPLCVLIAATLLLAFPTAPTGCAADMPVLPATASAHARLYAERAAAVVGITCEAPHQRGGSGQFFGTGVIISADGLILTLNTVVPRGARDIKVTLMDGRILTADLVRSDPASEGVLIRLSAAAGAPRGLVFMPLADSSACAVGDPVYSWGNPYLTIQNNGAASLSLGRISGLSVVSSSDDESRYRGPAIETDAALNPGSDGGPISDSAGNVIGLQTLAFSNRRWLSLAIPVAVLRSALSELAALPVTKPAGLNGESWDRERRLLAMAKRSEPAVVGVWVERVGDSLSVPETRQQEVVPAAAVIERNQRQFREAQIPEGCSSGFIVDAKGWVVTSALLVGDRVTARPPSSPGKPPTQHTAAVKNIWVFTADGQRHQARVLGSDGYRDIALLKIAGNAATFAALALRSSTSAISVGRSVALLGRNEAPGRLQMNIGIISAAQRQRGLFAQTTAMMNYGNLGGPVIDSDGVVLGMAAKLAPGSPWRQNCGVGFFLRSDHVLSAIPLLAEGKPLPPTALPYFGIACEVTGRGVTVKSVEPSGPASAAGLTAGDVLMRVESLQIDDLQSFMQLMAPYAVGERVRLTFLRQGSEKTTVLTIGAQPVNSAASATSASTPSRL